MYDQMTDAELRQLASEIMPDEAFDLWDRGSMISLIENHCNRLDDGNPYETDNPINEDGWEDLPVCAVCGEAKCCCDEVN